MGRLRDLSTVISSIGFDSLCKSWAAAPAVDRPTSVPLALRALTLPAPYSRRIRPVPPAPAVFDQLVIDVSAIGQGHVSKGELVVVEAAGLDHDFLLEAEVRGGVLGALAVGMAFLRAVDAAEVDALGVPVVKNFESIAVEDADHWPGKLEARQRA